MSGVRQQQLKNRWTILKFLWKKIEACFFKAKKKNLIHPSKKARKKMKKERKKVIIERITTDDVGERLSEVFKRKQERKREERKKQVANF
jgi:hypothetical protein